MATDISFDMARKLLPPRPENSHKGTYGHVFVLAGAPGFTGAPAMVCMGAYRAGAGLVTAGVPAPAAGIATAHIVEAMTLHLPATGNGVLGPDAVEAALAFARDKAAVAIGPGLTQDADAVRFVHAFLRACSVPLVIDADGLNAVSRDTSILREIAPPCILTPHPGEMARLAGLSTKEVQADRGQVAEAFAREHGCVVVLKGWRTVVAAATGDRYTNTTGNAGMASGGTGDVLCGVVASLLAQGLAPDAAARLGVYVHGLAGDYAAAEKTQRAMMARDLLDSLPTAWRQLEAEAPVP
ncbi:MAG: NAD(P)H-hydrate dehydratase [Candidatus Hydrogenedentota bacterium]